MAQYLSMHRDTNIWNGIWIWIFSFRSWTTAQSDTLWPFIQQKNIMLNWVIFHWIKFHRNQWRDFNVATCIWTTNWSHPTKMEQKSKYNNTKSENIFTMVVTWVEIVCVRCFHFIVLFNASSYQNVHFCSIKNNLCHPIQFIIFCLDYLCMLGKCFGSSFLWSSSFWCFVHFFLAFLPCSFSVSSFPYSSVEKTALRNMNT